MPWRRIPGIYGDQRDSLSLLDHGWIQVYAENNQEALDLALMAYAVAEAPRVSLPVMVNVDGFALTHTYESVEVPAAAEADAFLPPYRTANKFDFENPVNIGYSAGPEFNRYYQYWHHRDMLAAEAVVEEVEARFAEVFGRTYPGMVDAYLCEDADFVLVTLGSAAGLARDVADELRAQGKRAGVLRIRYYWHHRDMLAAEAVVEEVEARFAEVFGRTYPGMVDAYLCEDADFVLVTLGSAAGLARDVADELRAQGKRAGVLRIRYLRPMPDAALARALAGAGASAAGLARDVADELRAQGKRAGVLRIRYLRPMPDAALARALAGAGAVGVLEQDISFGGTGTVYANVLASLARAGVARPSANFIGGLGGDDISREAMRGAFAHLEALAAGEGASGEVVFFGVEEEGESDDRERAHHYRRGVLLRAQGVPRLRRRPSRAPSAQGARPPCGGGAARRLHERHRLQLPAAGLRQQRHDHAVRGHGGGALGHRGGLARPGRGPRGRHRGGLRRRRRHGGHRPAGALRRHRPQ